MKIAILAVPYDSGRRAYRMGAGPDHLLDNGLAQPLEHSGHTVTTQHIETTETGELPASFDVVRQLASSVAACVERGEWPLVLSGGCMAANGVFAGLRSRAAVLWLDAHADFNTPETSPSGFLDGMAVAILTGRCYRDRTKRMAGFEPLRDENLVMLGTRAIDPGENESLARVHRPRSSRQLWSTLARLQPEELYLHIDLDVLDPTVLRANGFAAPHGLSMHTLHDVIDAVKANQRIAALTISAYDPAADAANDGPRVVREIIEHAVS